MGAEKTPGTVAGTGGSGQHPTDHWGHLAL